MLRYIDSLGGICCRKQQNIKSEESIHSGVRIASRYMCWECVGGERDKVGESWVPPRILAAHHRVKKHRSHCLLCARLGAEFTQHWEMLLGTACGEN